MSNKQEQEPKWEVVDEIPGERKKEPPKPPIKSKLPKKAIFWTGLSIGCVLIVLARPLWGFFGNLFRNIVAYWWLILIALAYWVWARRKVRK